jgi:hypothetical protein
VVSWSSKKRRLLGFLLSADKLALMGLRPGLSSDALYGMALVGSFGTALLEALVEGLPALESGFYGVPVVDFCFA